LPENRTVFRGFFILLIPALTLGRAAIDTDLDTGSDTISLQRDLELVYVPPNPFAMRFKAAA
jgi:hypothetical protein